MTTETTTWFYGASDQFWGTCKARNEAGARKAARAAQHVRTTRSMWFRTTEPSVWDMDSGEARRLSQVWKVRGFADEAGHYAP